MNTFSSLPFELRSLVYSFCKPPMATIHIKEGADLVVTSIPSPSPLLTTSKESRAAAQEWDLKMYPILVGEDYQDMEMEEDATLHLVITPSEKEHLGVTWTELYTVLGDVLLDAKQVVIECSRPERLARLFMLPEAELIGVGQCCVENALFGEEIVASDRSTREALRNDFSLIVGGEEWVVRDVVVKGFGSEASFTTKELVKRDCPAETVGHELEEEEEEVEEKWLGVPLTEVSLAKLRAETDVLDPEAAYDDYKEDAGGSVTPESLLSS
ncbi:hypothetical protein ACN47E_008504 [Coniothyrium glycines]